MAHLSRFCFIPVSVGALSLILLSSSGCIQRQMARMTVKESKSPGDVLKAAEAVVRERYYQVKVYPSSHHLVALSPIDAVGNYPVRKKIDVYVFLENGYYMPNVSVRQYINNQEPPHEKGGPIGPRFPIEVSDNPAPTDDWDPLYYDRNEEVEIRNAILARLKTPS